MSIRRRNLARGWYPVDRRECEREIESFLEGWSPPPGLKDPKGGIVPHAGWYFSGKLATRVFYLLKQSAGAIDLIVLYGGHLGPKDLPRVVMESEWETPFGSVTMAKEVAVELGRRIDLKPESPSSGDNTMEIHLPLIKYFFPHTKLLAIRSPSSLEAVRLGEEVARIGKERGLPLLAVGSTDLTHYGPNYGFVSRGIGPSALRWVREENDRRFIEYALQMDAKRLIEHANEEESACSAGAAASAIATCRELGSGRGRLIDYYTSYEIMPDESFVGYAGIVYEG